MHHKDGPNCPLCDEKLKEVHWYLSMWFHWLKAKKPDVHVAWGFRSEEDQNRALKEGSTRLSWPKSKHNNVDEKGFPYSEALDIFQIINGTAIFDEKFYELVYVMSLGRSYQITWGGTWKSFPDRDHFEISGDFNAIHS